jgi:outer membrane biosynthesis protein TonB
VTFTDEPGGAAKGSATPVASATQLASPEAFLIPVTLADMPPASIVALSDTQVDLEAAGDGSESDPGRVLMFGRYVGQISARIERAWIKPRAPIAEGQFACRARILQNTDGGVQEIELEGCNGDPAWQLSLVHAIQSASPLPAPPDPSVFARTLRIPFKADPFVTGGSPDGFESESRTARN